MRPVNQGTTCVQDILKVFTTNRGNNDRMIPISEQFARKQGAIGDRDI